MTDSAALNLGSETLLAIGLNDGEQSLEHFLPAAIAGITLKSMLWRCMTIGASLANAEDQQLDNASFWLDLANSLTDTPLPEPVRDGIALGWRLTNLSQLANLALYTVLNDNYKGLAKNIAFLRLLGLFNCASFKHVNSDLFYIEPDSIAAGFAVMTSHRVRFMNEADRYLSFIEWGDSQFETNVRQLVEDTLGMSFEDHVRCVAALQAFFDPSDVGVNGVQPLHRYAIRDDVPLMRWLDARSNTYEQLNEQFGQDRLLKLRDEGYYLVLQRPFVRVGDEYFLLNPRALENQLGLGVFFAGMDAITSRATNYCERKKAAQEFGGIAGRWYQQYAGERVSRIAQRSGSYFRKEIIVKNFRSIDFFVLEGERLVLFEMYHGRVARDVVQGLDAGRINKSFEQVIYHKIEQLDATIRAIADKRLTTTDIDFARVTHVYPVVCLAHSFPRSSSIQEKLDRDIAANGWLPTCVGQYYIAPFEIIDCESLEGLDGTDRPISFSELIDAKTSAPISRFTFFKNFLINTQAFRLQMDSADQQRRAGLLTSLQKDANSWIGQVT